VLIGPVRPKQIQTSQDANGVLWSDKNKYGGQTSTNVVYDRGGVDPATHLDTFRSFQHWVEQYGHLGRCRAASKERGNQLLQSQEQSVLVHQVLGVGLH
jgi:hypothetical protein